MGSSCMNRYRLLIISYSVTSIMKVTLDINPALADEILKLHQIHNIRVLDFSRAEEYMQRMRYDISDKVMTLVTHEVLENARMLTLKHD